MEIRFYIDAETGEPHIFDHDVTEDEVLQVMLAIGDDYPAARDSRMKLGQTAAGRYLQVIYVPDEEPNSVFVITAYDFERQGEKSVSAPTKEEETMNDQRFPPGWDEARVRDVLAHYESQTDDEQFAEIEAANEIEGVTMMAVPTELVPEVRALLAKKRSA